MNRFAYLTTGLAVKALSGLSRADILIHGKENIPKGSLIFAVNHFTRIETLILPTYIYELTGNTPVWSLADDTLFKGAIKGYFEQVGAVSTRDPDRDRLIVKTLLQGNAAWIIFPEGRMMKNKKIMDRGRFMMTHEAGKRPPHTGVATLALRTEFYRRRLDHCLRSVPAEAQRLAELFDLRETASVARHPTWIVPVNLTYYPLRAKENVLSRLAVSLMENLPERAVEEIMTEGSMLLEGVDVDIRFGPAIDMRPYVLEGPLSKLIHADRELDPDASPDLRKALKRLADTVMHRCMTAIYQMTTVNHDHLFSSILKAMPSRFIDPDDLCRRVFLLTADPSSLADVHFHRSLASDQVHLLSDDRYGKLKDFMSVALEKGVLVSHSGGYLKNPSVFRGMIPFHQVRTRNPLLVMANEVEPLAALQKKIRKIAWTPGFWVQRKTADHLLKRALSQYDADWKAHYVTGESRSKDIGAPFLIIRGRRDIGALLIHGYMAAPFEMAGLAVHLARRGVSVYAPRLRGHGTTPEDLAGRTYQDWLRSAEEGFALIRSLCRKVVIGGFSTGAALALDLAARVSGAAGVFAVCPPRRLKDPSLKKNLAVDIWKRMVEKMWGSEDRRKLFIDNAPENPHISYLRNPVTGIREIELLMERLDGSLPLVRTPALVVHTLRDPIANPDESKRIFEALGSVNKRYVVFNMDRHTILSGPDSRMVHQAISDFIQENR